MISEQLFRHVSLTRGIWFRSRKLLFTMEKRQIGFQFLYLVSRREIVLTRARIPRAYVTPAAKAEVEFETCGDCTVSEIKPRRSTDCKKNTDIPFNDCIRVTPL